MKRKSTYAWARYGFVVKEKDKSHDVRREEEDDDKISTNRDQSTNEESNDIINKESNDINNLSSKTKQLQHDISVRKCFNIINDDSRFYVRPIGTGSDTISSLIDCQSENDFNNCPVCTIESQINTYRYFNCSHLLCSTCYNQWSEARRDSNVTCPTCRSH